MTRARVTDGVVVRRVQRDPSPARLRFEWQRAGHAGGSWPEIERRTTFGTPMHAMYGRRATDEVSLPTPSRASAVAVRAVDVVASTLGLIALAPVLGAVALAVKCTSRGPVLFRQARVGRHHRHFQILKFRTMTAGTYDSLAEAPDAWADYVANGYKLPRTDERITRVGRFLRASSLDELPQLINVLCGHMSIVGVRPLVPAELGARPAHSQGLYGLLRPGMTGLWQVSGRSLLSSSERIELDDRYVMEWGVRTNLSIMARTPLAVIQANGSA